jgi:hypothetical protein
MKRLALFILPIAIILGSCKKYQDGPAISFNTKKHRVVNSWVIEKVLESGQDATNNYKAAYYDFNLVTSKDNTYTLSYVANGITNYSESGTWDFANNKTEFSIYNSANSNYSAIGNHWVIYRLKEKEFWIKTINSNGQGVEVHFMPK